MNKSIHEKKCNYCGKVEHYAKGLCKNCYNRLWKRGTLEYYKPPTESWYERNKEKVLNNCKKYREKNKEKIRKAQKDYYNNNIEKEKKRKHIWYLKNRERIIEKQKEYNKNKKIRRVNNGIMD